MRNEPCSISDCSAKITVARGWCSRHYATWVRHGTPTGGTERGLPPITRFLDKIKIGGDCWIWTAASRGGCGQFWPGGSRKTTRVVKAHRWSFAYHTGIIIPKDKEVCHKCDQPLCVNPDHLWLGTHKENLADSSAKGRQLGNSRSKNGRTKLTEDEVKTIRKNFSDATGKQPSWPEDMM